MIRRDADILRLDLRAPQGRGHLRDLTLSDVESVRLVLRGGSPIDWHRLNFENLSEVDDLLRTNLLDPDDARDLARLEYLHREAIRYLKRNFAFRFPVELESPEDVRHLFLYASEGGRLNRVQILSCVVLKTMHSINHLESRELLHASAVPESELLQIVERQVHKRARKLSDEGLPIVHFYGSRKTRDSMVSKLISKKAARASDILDKLRFRVVVETRDDIVPVLSYLIRHVFPWNQVTAGESSNNLVHFRRYLEENDALRRFLPALQVDTGLETDEDPDVHNEFSGSSYRMINFIIDVPIRLDHILDRVGDPWLLQSGSIVYVGCEFQVVDQETAYLNEQGENSHRKYKSRQAERVSDRLMWGLLRERRRNGGRRPEGSLRLARKPRTLSKLDKNHRSGPAAPAPEAPRVARPPRPQLPVMAPPTTSLPHLPAVNVPAGFVNEDDSLLRPALGGPKD